MTNNISPESDSAVADERVALIRRNDPNAPAEILSGAVDAGTVSLLAACMNPERQRAVRDWLDRGGLPPAGLDYALRVLSGWLPPPRRPEPLLQKAVTEPWLATCLAVAAVLPPGQVATRRLLIEHVASGTQDATTAAAAQLMGLTTHMATLAQSRILAPTQDPILASYVIGDYEACASYGMRIFGPTADCCPPTGATVVSAAKPSVVQLLCLLHANIRDDNRRGLERWEGEAHSRLSAAVGQSVNPWGTWASPDDPAKIRALRPHILLAAAMAAASHGQEALLGAWRTHANEADLDDDGLRILRADLRAPWRGGREARLRFVLRQAREFAAKENCRQACEMAEWASAGCGDWTGPLGLMKGRAECMAGEMLRLRGLAEESRDRLRAALAALSPATDLGDLGILELRRQLVATLRRLGERSALQEQAILLLAHAHSIPAAWADEALEGLHERGMFAPGETPDIRLLAPQHRFERAHRDGGAQAVLEATQGPVASAVGTAFSMMWRARAYHELDNDEEARDCLRGMFDAFEAAEREQLVESSTDMMLETELERLGLKAIADELRHGGQA